MLSLAAVGCRVGWDASIRSCGYGMPFGLGFHYMNDPRG